MNLDGIEHQNGALSSRSQKGAEMSASEEETIHVHLIRQERERATFSGDKNHSFGPSLSSRRVLLPFIFPQQKQRLLARLRILYTRCVFG